MPRPYEMRLPPPHQRLGDYAIAAIASGPLLDVTTNSPIYAGHPSPANVLAAYFASLADPIINSITYPSVASP